MSAVLWMLTGAALLLALAVSLAMVIDEQVRRDITAAVLGVMALPAMVPAALLIWLAQRGDLGARPLSNRALARFAQQRQREDVDRHAWVFSIASRGVILVRKAPRPVPSEGRAT